MKEIPVGEVLRALVDDVDVDRVMAYTWTPFSHVRGGRETVYAVARVGRRLVRMHRFIMDAKVGVLVDHRNHDGLDNRRENLRVCSHQQNQFNSRVHSDNQIGIKGVGPDGHGRWRARATIDRRTVTIGVFNTPAEASAAYRKFAERNHGEFFCAG